jgi:hypothetical protein
MATTNLTPKQERFAQEYVRTGNATEAYRSSYESTGLDSTVNPEASRLTHDPKIAARIQEIQAPYVAEIGLTVKGVLTDLQGFVDAAKLGTQHVKASDGIRALELLGRYLKMFAPEEKPDFSPVQITRVTVVLPPDDKPTLMEGEVVTGDST